MKTFNLFGEDWDREETRPGWRSKDGWVGARLGAELLGGSVYELAAGDRLWPYHAVSYTHLTLPTSDLV